MKRLLYRIALTLARRRYAKALVQIENFVVSRRHRRWCVATIRHPDGTTSEWWEPWRRRRPDLFGERAAASIARHELPYDYPDDDQGQPWHFYVPFDRRHHNPYTIQSHR